MKNYLFLLIISLFAACSAFAQERAKPRPGEGVSTFLQRFGRTKKQHIRQFIELNKSKLARKNGLKLGVDYLLPPLEEEKREPLFGKKLARYTVASDELGGACFYLVGGHGGPDPGAIGIYRGKQLHEDEYAYDIILRLARDLLIRGAKVHIIIQDAKDGIRDNKCLANSRRETCMGDPIPLNQLERLKQRCDKINYLFAKDKEAYKRAVFIHVDSRGKGEQTDVFFYHSPGSKPGERLAHTIRKTFDKKYDKHQPDRGFRGTVSERALYVLRHSVPVSVFLELGNIQNKRDRQRIMLDDNRQALANWVCEGLTADYKAARK